MSVFTAANFMTKRISELQTEIRSYRESLEKAKLQLVRVDYNKLEQLMSTLEKDLDRASALVETDSESEDAIGIILDVADSLKAAKPLLYESLPVETRGMWLDNFTMATFYSREDITRHLDELQSININIIFPDVYGNGASVYKSEIVPQLRVFQHRFTEENEDVLTILIEEAHKRNMEVHPLVRVFALHNGVEYFINDRIDWLDKTRENKFTLANGYYWLSPAHPEVREYNLAMLKELAENYDIDGVHLDYIRYDADYGYNLFTRNLFKELFGVDPLDIDSTRLEDIFKVFKAQFVNKFVERAFYELKAIKPNLLISSAVASPHSWGKNDLGQDWLSWAENRIVHFLTPMSYRTTAEQYRGTVTSEINTIKGTTYIYTGLGVYLFNDSVLLEQLKAGQDVAMTGQAIFSTANMKSHHYIILKNGPWSQPAVSTFRDPLHAAQLLVTDLQKRLNEFAPISANPELLQQYRLTIDNLAEKISSLDLRPWESRNLHEANPNEVEQLEPIINDIKEISIQINRDSKREMLIPELTANRIINDLGWINSLLLPLLYTSTPYEYIPTR